MDDHRTSGFVTVRHKRTDGRGENAKKRIVVFGATGPEGYFDEIYREKKTGIKVFYYHDVRGGDRDNRNGFCLKLATINEPSRRRRVAATDS